MASVLDTIKHYQQVIEKYSDDESRVLRCIDKLFNLKVTVQHLQETGVGRTVNALRKEPGEVGQAARALVLKWKTMVAAEESDQEGDLKNDTSTQNGHGSAREPDDRLHQSKSYHDRHSTSRNSTPKSNKEQPTDMNGHHSGSKRKYHSSEEEDQDAKKKSRHNSTSEDDHKSQVIKKEKVSDSESSDEDSESSDSDSESYTSESSQEEVKVKKEIKQEIKIEKKESPDRHRSSSSKHSDSNRGDHKRESSSSKRLDSDKHSNHKSHKEVSRSSSELTSKSSSQKHKSSHESESSSDKRQKSDTSSDEKKESKSSNKRTTENYKSSSQKENRHESSEKHKSSSDKHSNKEHKTSSHTEKAPEKHRSSSESSKHKSRESSRSSKEKHSSSSRDKEKSKERSTSSKERSSSSKERSSHNSEKKHSSSDSKSQNSDKSKHKNDDVKDSSEKRKESKEKSRSSSHKSKSSSSSSKSKEEVPKKKIKLSNSEDSGEDGIDCGSGASFAEALGMISPTKPKKKSIRDISSPNNSFINDLSPACLLAPSAKLAPLPALEISALPEISPNYKPRPPPKLLPHFSDEDALSAGISSKNQRTKVYSGNKVIGGKIPSLYEMCVHVLQEHIDALEYTGGVPYDILKPVVDRATPQQLFVLEHYNPYLMEDTNHLWQKFCERSFRCKKRQELESWREMYMRCQEEQEHKLKSLTANIRMTQEAKKAPIKQTKMAYVDSVVKPPRNIARKQAMHGTAHAATASPASRVASLAATPGVLKGGAPRPPPAAPVSSAAFNKPKKAPLMQKALQFMRGRKR